MWFPAVIISSLRKAIQSLSLSLRVTLESVCLACLFCILFSDFLDSSILLCSFVFYCQNSFRVY